MTLHELVEHFLLCRLIVCASPSEDGYLRRLTDCTNHHMRMARARGYDVDEMFRQAYAIEVVETVGALGQASRLTAESAGTLDNE